MQKNANVIGLHTDPTKYHKKTTQVIMLKPYSRGLLLLLRGADIFSSIIHSDCMPCIK